MWLSTRVVAVAALALAAGGAAAAGGSTPPEVTAAVVALSRADGALRPDVAPCTFVHISPAAGNGTRDERLEYAYSLGRGGVHDIGFSAPFLRADVPGNVAATGDAGEAGGEPSRFFYQVRGGW